MTELTELDAYKQLLEVTENILQQLTPEEEIVRKYYTLKKSVLGKVKNYSSDKSYVNKVLTSYKNLARNMLQCVAEFQAQIEGQMSKSNFIRNTVRLIKQVEKQTKQLSEELNSITDQTKGIKLMLKQQVNAFKFVTKEFEGKIQNMSLMIEVHRKMHEIILDASQKEIKTTQKEAEYNKRLNQMEDVVDRINDVKKFIQSYEITERKARKFDLARKNLAKVLFDL